jgi:codanin-1
MQLHPDFDVKPVLLRAIEERKLLVTIPWLVEYLAMLDFITIRLDYYRDLFQLLNTVYIRMNVVEESSSMNVMLTSKFIVRACLGWLFEHPDLPEDYSSSNSFKSALKTIETDAVAPAEKLRSSDNLNPQLEAILNAACPFLADFRVSMMPQRTTKAVSRTGRYRHITTKFQDKTNTQKTKVQDNRERLIEAFLASQTLSVRKIVDFAIDRVTSAVVKDFQVKHLLTIRKQAKTEVEQLAPSVKDAAVLAKKIAEIYRSYLKKLQDQWDQDVVTNSTARIQGAFDSLLPIETLADVRSTLFNVTLERTSKKLHEWSSTNIATIEIFSKDIQLDAAKLKENQQTNGNKKATSNIVIDLTAQTMPSDSFKDLQLLLHKASRHPEDIEADELRKCIEMLSDVTQKQTLPSNAFRNIAFYMLQLVLLCIVNRVELISSELLAKVFALWRLEKLVPYTKKHPQNDENPQNRRKVDDFLFSNVISARFLVTLQGKNRSSFIAYGDFLVLLVRQGFITSEQINEQSVKLYKTDWPTESLNDIAFLINHIKDSLSSSASSESQLFLDLVVDLARDMENF